MPFYRAIYSHNDLMFLKEDAEAVAEEVCIEGVILMYAIVSARNSFNAEIKARKIGFQVEMGRYKDKELE